MTKKTLILLLLIFTYGAIQAQDTLRAMVYNLLYYGQFTDFCTPSNNNPNNKDAAMRTILAYDLPDIFVVNEITRNPVFHQRIIDSVFNKITDKPYARAQSLNVSNSNIMNMMYYNPQKLTLQAQYIMQSFTRDIDLYTLYYNSPDLAQGDTVFIHCIAAHLKAGSSASDQQQRTNQINNVLAWLNSNKQPGNYLFMGDFNMKSASELAFQLLINGPHQEFWFYDPVNQIGNWYNNSAFVNYHTQSTRTSGSCHAGGGLDDRFDFILASADVMQGNKGLRYLEDSYTTLGQDGQRLKKSLIDQPFNSATPLNVTLALYDNSDHLPVLMSLVVDQSPASGNLSLTPSRQLRYSNPVKDELVIFSELFHNPTDLTIDIYSVQGALLESFRHKHSMQPLQISLNHLSTGFYFLDLRTKDFSTIIKVVKL